MAVCDPEIDWASRFQASVVFWVSGMPGIENVALIWIFHFDHVLAFNQLIILDMPYQIFRKKARLIF